MVLALLVSGVRIGPCPRALLRSFSVAKMKNSDPCPKWRRTVWIVAKRSVGRKYCKCVLQRSQIFEGSAHEPSEVIVRSLLLQGLIFM